MEAPLPPHFQLGEEAGEPTADGQILADEAGRILSEYIPQNHQDDTRRVLRAFLDCLPLRGQQNLVQDILSQANNPSQLRQTRNFLVDAVLKPMKTAGARGSRSTPISKPPEVEELEEIEEISGGIEPSTRNDQGSLKSRCLRRDGFRCLITGVYDKDSVDKRLINLPEGGVTTFTNCAHILPFSLRDFERERSREMADSYLVTPLETTATTTPPTFPVRQAISLASSDDTIPPPSPGFLDVHSRIGRILEEIGSDGGGAGLAIIHL
ncbi:uncharacterized protein DNG_01061 [Cephalotrichum gorgonifer]|uniref:HNH nuclease domain-containing protein n=1 Tax=Cephalotrichum gorgonifer TaxID=2041049 RepID=A0AAE8MPU2_9PEZI|nr:uncharacterized protein DNG_01061 [Cephalotrichum gorgonifer]